MILNSFFKNFLYVYIKVNFYVYIKLLCIHWDKVIAIKLLNNTFLFSVSFKMWIVQQATKLKWKIWIFFVGSGGGSGSRNENGKPLPDSFRGIFCGHSGYWETKVLLYLLFDEIGLRFENVYVYSKSVYQLKFHLLQDVLKKIKGISYFPFQNREDVIEVGNAEPYSILIFDDVACESQEIILEFFSEGRHKSIYCAYLSQTYSLIPKQLCRHNFVANCCHVFGHVTTYNCKFIDNGMI